MPERPTPRTNYSHVGIEAQEDAPIPSAISTLLVKVLHHEMKDACSVVQAHVAFSGQTQT